MNIVESIKKFLLADLAIGVAMTIALWMSIGTEGMAAKFCSLINIEKCNEVEWSDDYEPVERL